MSHELRAIRYPLSTIHHSPSTIRYFFLLLLAVLLFTAVSPAPVHAVSSPNVSLDRDVYRDMEFWAAEGLVESQLYSIRTVARSEVGRQLVLALGKCNALKTPSATCRTIQEKYARLYGAEIAEARSPDNINNLYIKPVEAFLVSYNYRSGPFSVFNNEGIPYGDGHNALIQFQTHARVGRVLSFFVEPAFIYNQHFGDAEDGSRADMRLHKGYAKLTLFNVELQVGRDSLWWGPGHHGSLLMSNNAHPFDMIKLSNPEPVLLPWIFSYLGPVQFNVFFSQLNDQRKGRELANPFLYGMRLGLKPHPYLELGASHLVLFGGPGRRDMSFREIIDTLYGNTDRKGEKTDSNQEMSADLALTIPNLKKYIYVVDGIKFYGEIGAEDNGYPPTGRAYLAGLAFFQPFGLERAVLRGEYAILSPDKGAAGWYNHVTYPMRYEDRVFGHHAGADAEDIFIEWSHSFEKIFYKLGFDRERSGIKTQTYIQTKNQFFGEIGYRFNANATMTLRYAYEAIKNFGNLQDENQGNHFVGLEAAIEF
ncbi:MAG: capsule assembly Wzi family protein [Deltaproteobacteria bacterium]